MFYAHKYTNNKLEQSDISFWVDSVQLRCSVNLTELSDPRRAAFMSVQIVGPNNASQT